MDRPLLERYEILEEIGRGGMGRVVRARDLSLLRLVAIKIVPAGNDPNYIERLTREARATALLSHPNIVAVYEMGQMDDSAFIVMEYVTGHTLETRMRGVPPAEWGRFVPMLAQCAGALDYAHRKGIVHRDIKPSNIMIRDDAVAKVLDFGIARVAASREASVTQTGTFVGTPLYMAPEQIFAAKADPRTDQYALAVIAYTLLAGRHPFTGTEVLQLIRQITQDLPPRPSSFNPALSRKADDVLLKALSKDPAKRFESCVELFAELDRCLSEEVASGTLVTRSLSWFKQIFLLPKTKPEDRGEIKSEKQAPLDKPPIPMAPVAELGPSPTVEVSLPVERTSDRDGSSAGIAVNPAAMPSTVSGSDLDSRSGGSSRMFEGGAARAASQAATPPPAPASETGPGEFTRMFQAAEQTRFLRKAPESRVDADTLARAQARELVQMVEQRDFESAVALRGKWLPGIEGATGELVGFSEAARYLGAAQDAVSPHVRIEHLKRAEKVLFSIGNQLLADNSAASRHLPEALEAWKMFARELLAAAQQKAESELPNPFRAGQPLRPDEGRSVFRGRTSLVRRIEAILADADQNSSLALLGPRRCGKTSLLQMLPAMLPDCACVFFDLQDNPVKTVPQFFEALVRRAREQVRSQRRIEIPGLDGPGAFETATRWFDQLDHMEEVNRFLISIDEFERLEDLFPGDRQDLLRLMGLFRATIQHRRRIRLLVSGVAPFEELGPLWNDHFINVRELRIGHLDEDTSIDLLSKPIPEFPPDAVPVQVARRVFERTAGQPYLLQLFGTLLVNRLNEQERTQAVIDDVTAVEQEALSQGRYYFGNTYTDAPPVAREVLHSLARGETVTIPGATRRWLERRWLIDEKGALRPPVLGAFIREEFSA